MSKKYAGFDIETAEPAPEDGGDYAIGVTCAAVLKSGDSEPRLWAAGPVGPDGRYPEKMTPESVCDLVNYLCGLVYEEGYTLTGVNSLGFDLRVLAEECQDLAVYDDLRDLALAHYDPGFQMLAERGFMVGVKALGIGLQLTEQKSADMDGMEAVRLWSGFRKDQDRVLEYVAQDARTTLAIIEALESKRWTWKQWDHDLRRTIYYEDRQAIRWLTKKGKISHHHIKNGLLMVKECLELPLPKTDWMDSPRARAQYAGWTNARTLEE